MPSVAARRCTSWPMRSAARCAAYLRPLVLIQAEPRRAGVETLDFERVRAELIANHHIPAEEIVVATGEEKGWRRSTPTTTGHCRPGVSGEVHHHPEGAGRGLGLPVCLHSGQHGLAVIRRRRSNSSSARVAAARRQPSASRLNQSYAFVVSRNFAETAARCASVWWRAPASSGAR
jgi:type III restriction enzyme